MTAEPATIYGAFDPSTAYQGIELQPLDPARHTPWSSQLITEAVGIAEALGASK